MNLRERLFKMAGKHLCFITIHHINIINPISEKIINLFINDSYSVHWHHTLRYIISNRSQTSAQTGR